MSDIVIRNSLTGLRSMNLKLYTVDLAVFWILALSLRDNPKQKAHDVSLRQLS